MKTILKFMACLVVSIFVYFPSGYAAVHHTKTSLTNWIVTQSKQKVERSVAEVIVASVLKHAREKNIDPFLIVSLIKNESSFNPRAKSSYGAQGLMQVVPRFHRDKIAGRSILNIDTNVEVGTQVLGDCLLRHKGVIRLALKCYSGGARNYTEKLSRSYKDIKRYDVVYRFENEIPITVTSSFQNPGNFSHSPPSDFITVAGIQ